MRKLYNKRVLEAKYDPRHRKHCKVYVVEDETQETLYVGSGCCRKYLNREPSQEEIKCANAVLAQEKRTAQARFIQEKANQLLNEALRVLSPLDYELRIDTACEVLATYNLSETQKGKVWEIVKQALWDAYKTAKQEKKLASI